MDATSKLARTAVAATLSLTFAAAPATATAAPVPLAAAQDAGEEGGGKIQMAETPRDRVGLILLVALGAMGAGAAVTMSRQMRGTRPQADGEFRWR